MSPEIAMKIYYSSMKAGIFVVLNYLLNLLLDREVKLKLWRYVLVFLVMFCTFFHFGRSAHASESVNLHTESHSIEYPDADVGDINFSSTTATLLSPDEMDLYTFSPVPNFIIEKNTPLETQEEVEDYLRSLGITVTYD
jgi:hypothetical protein